MKYRHKVTSRAMNREEKRRGQTFGEAFANETLTGGALKAASKLFGADLDKQRPAPGKGDHLTTKR